MSVPPLRVPRRLQYRVFPGGAAAMRGPGGFGHSGVIDVSVVDDSGSDEQGHGQERQGSSRRRGRGQVGLCQIMYMAMAFAAGLITGFTLATVLTA